MTVTRVELPEEYEGAAEMLTELKEDVFGVEDDDDAGNQETLNEDVEFDNSDSGKKDKLKLSIKNPPDLELQELPHHLEYALLEKDSKLPGIIASHLSKKQKEKQLDV